MFEIPLRQRYWMVELDGRHSPFSAVEKFALQKHELLPGTDVLVLPQSSHGDAPDAFLYVPAPHAMHGPPSGPLVPGGHKQPSL